MTATAGVVRYPVGAPTIDGVLVNVAAVLDALRPDGIADLDWFVWRIEALLQVRAMLDRELEAIRRVH